MGKRYISDFSNRDNPRDHAMPEPIRKLRQVDFLCECGSIRMSASAMDERD